MKVLGFGLILGITLIIYIKEIKEGVTLKLLRSSGIVTNRAVFEYPEDCRYIASIMSEKEPQVKWFCQ